MLCSHRGKIFVYLFVKTLLMESKVKETSKYANSAGFFFVCEDKIVVFLFQSVSFTVHLPVFMCAGV